MKVLSKFEGLAIPATIVTANLAKDTQMAISANETVDKAGANATSIGSLTVPSKTANGIGTVETCFKELVEIEADGLLTYGMFVKLGALNGDGEQTAKEWVDGTDSVKRIIGVVWKGAADEGTAKVLKY